jgi:CheY-like chemotaxis protein/nitrogen-specific signal transduction histidine kinase
MVSAEIQSLWDANGIPERVLRSEPAAVRSEGRHPSVAELEQLKGQFLASLNHEIRTPLSGLMGMADLLAETALDAEQGEYLGGIRECAQQLLETLNSVLDYSAIVAGKLRQEESEFPLIQFIESLAAESLVKAKAKGLTLSLKLDDSLPETAIGDARLLSQAVSHLLGNAVKFTEHGGVELRITHQVLSGRKMMLTVTVRDTGIGIAEEMLDVLFESFRQLDGGLARRHSGLGLGLALVDKLVKLMNGKIEVTSKQGMGSNFTLRVPLRTPPGAPASQESANLGRRSRRILVVDDNKIAQQLVGHILGRAGYEIEFAGSGELAISKAATSAFDLVLMDLQMPGMDGLSATRKIRGIDGYANVPVLALTANYADEYRVLCEQTGMQGFLCKPFQKEELLRTVRALA